MAADIQRACVRLCYFAHLPNSLEKQFESEITACKRCFHLRFSANKSALPPQLLWHFVAVPFSQLHLVFCEKANLYFHPIKTIKNDHLESNLPNILDTGNDEL